MSTLYLYSHLQMIMNKMLRGLKFCGTSVMVLGGKGESVKRAVIFLHGSGDSGLGMTTWLKQLGYNPDPDIVLIIPSAPLRPYTLAGGEKSAVGMKIANYELKHSTTFSNYESCYKL